MHGSLHSTVLLLHCSFSCFSIFFSSSKSQPDNKYALPLHCYIFIVHDSYTFAMLWLCLGSAVIIIITTFYHYPDTPYFASASHAEKRHHIWTAADTNSGPAIAQFKQSFSHSSIFHLQQHQFHSDRIVWICKSWWQFLGRTTSDRNKWKLEPRHRCTGTIPSRYRF